MNICFIKYKCNVEIKNIVRPPRFWNNYHLVCKKNEKITIKNLIKKGKKNVRSKYKDIN